MPKLWILITSTLLLLEIASACSNANVQVSGLNKTSSQSVVTGPNPINASASGATAYTSSGGYLFKVKVAPAQMDPTLLSADGHKVMAKVVNW